MDEILKEAGDEKAAGYGKQPKGIFDKAKSFFGIKDASFDDHMEASIYFASNDEFYDD